jgi:hypothetical protein
MSKQISSLWVGLTGNLSGLSASFGAAIKPVKGLSVALGTAGVKLRAFANTGTKLATAGLAVGALGAAAGLVALTKSSFEAIDTLKDQAESIGVTTAALSRLQYAASFAGIEAGAVTDAMGKMLVALNGAKDGTGPAADALKLLGMSAADLTKMSPEQAFAALSDGVAGIRNASDKAAAAVALFGKSGKTLIPVLNMGSAALAEAYIEADRLGVTISEMDARQIEAGADAMGRMGWAVQGVGNQIAIKLAPMIEAAAVKLVDLGTSGEGIGPKVSAAFEWVATAAGTVSDYVELLKAGFYAFRGVASVALLGTLQPLAAVIQAVEWLGQKLGIISDESTWGAFSAGLVEGVAQEADRAFTAAGESMDRFNAKANSAGVAAAFAATKIPKGGVSTAEPGDGFDDEVASGITQLGAMWDTFRRGAMSLGRDAFGSVAEKLKEQAKSLKDEARAITEAVRTPAEVFGDEIAKLQKLFDMGLISPEALARATEAARATLAGDTAVEQRSLGAVAAVSAEAQLARYRGPQVMPIRGPAKTEEKVLAENKKQSGLQRQIAAGIEALVSNAQSLVEVTF